MQSMIIEDTYIRNAWKENKGLIGDETEDEYLDFEAIKTRKRIIDLQEQLLDSSNTIPTSSSSSAGAILLETEFLHQLEGFISPTANICILMMITGLLTLMAILHSTCAMC